MFSSCSSLLLSGLSIGSCLLLSGLSIGNRLFLSSFCVSGLLLGPLFSRRLLSSLPLYLFFGLLLLPCLGSLPLFLGLPLSLHLLLLLPRLSSLPLTFSLHLALLLSRHLQLVPDVVALAHPIILQAIILRVALGIGVLLDLVFGVLLEGGDRRLARVNVICLGP